MKRPLWLVQVNKSIDVGNTIKGLNTKQNYEQQAIYLCLQKSEYIGYVFPTNSSGFRLSKFKRSS